MRYFTLSLLYSLSATHLPNKGTLFSQYLDSILVPLWLLDPQLVAALKAGHESRTLPRGHAWVHVFGTSDHFNLFCRRYKKVFFTFMQPNTKIVFGWNKYISETWPLTKDWENIGSTMRRPEKKYARHNMEWQSKHQNKRWRYLNYDYE